MSEEKRPERGEPEDRGYTPASPVKRTLAYFTGTMLGNLGPLLTVPGLVGLGALFLVSWRTVGRPGKGPAILLAFLCFALALLTLPIGITGLMSNFRG